VRLGPLLQIAPLRGRHLEAKERAAPFPGKAFRPARHALSGPPCGSLATAIIPKELYSLFSIFAIVPL